MKPILALAILAGTSAAGADLTIDRDQSVFAVVTHKAGIAARLAHNHMVYPEKYDVKASLPGDRIEEGTFQIDFPTTALVVDDPQAKQKWFPRIQAAGVLEEPFEEVPDADRAKIRQTMLSAEQLDAGQFPTIHAEVKSIRPQVSKQGGVEFTHVVQLSFTVHGKTVVKDVPARIELSSDTAKVEAVGRFRFTEFGIKPYSAVMGAVKNRDDFDLYVNVVAHRK